MSAFLQRLIARSQGETQGPRPRQRSLFELPADALVPTPDVPGDVPPVAATPPPPTPRADAPDDPVGDARRPPTVSPIPDVMDSTSERPAPRADSRPAPPAPPSVRDPAPDARDEPADLHASDVKVPGPTTVHAPEPHRVDPVSDAQAPRAQPPTSAHLHRSPAVSHRDDALSEPASDAAAPSRPVGRLPARDPARPGPPHSEAIPLEPTAALPADGARPVQMAAVPTRGEPLGRSSDAADPEAQPSSEVAAVVRPTARLAPRAEPEAAVRLDAEEAPEPTVHISIGRVEVRAVQPPPPPRRPVPERPPPLVSLDDYLAQTGTSP